MSDIFVIGLVCGAFFGIGAFNLIAYAGGRPTPIDPRLSLLFALIGGGTAVVAALSLGGVQ